MKILQFIAECNPCCLLLTNDIDNESQFYGICCQVAKLFKLTRFVIFSVTLDKVYIFNVA